MRLQDAYFSYRTEAGETDTFMGTNHSVPEGLVWKAPKNSRKNSLRHKGKHAQTSAPSRREAHGEKLRCRKRKKCRLSVLKTWILRLLSLQHREKESTATGSLREGAGAERLKEKAQLLFFCFFNIPLCFQLSFLKIKNPQVLACGFCRQCSAFHAFR